LSLLRIDFVVAGYGEVPILDGVTMEVDSGELVVVIGPNGAGKSTLLKCIAGLLDISRGDITFKGRTLVGTRAEQRLSMGLAYVPQTANVFPSLSGRENLELGFVGGRRERREGLKRRTDEICDLFPEMRQILSVPAYVLSGGQRQTLAFAKALMSEPALMLLDEPSAGLSPRLVAELFRHVAHLVTLGIGVLLVEQNAKQALSVGDRGYVLDSGRNALTGPASELLHDERTVALYLGQK
jgi:ABC-type branched-subunit amino acid transport system ATPase component